MCQESFASYRYAVTACPEGSILTPNKAFLSDERNQGEKNQFSQLFCCEICLIQLKFSEFELDLLAVYCQAQIHFTAFREQFVGEAKIVLYIARDVLS